jgi:hypothetical protein
LSDIAVLPSLRAAFAFWRRGLAAAPGPLAVAVAASALSAGAAWTGAASWRSLAILLQVIGWVFASGAMGRLALADDHPGEAAFRIGPYGFQATAQDRRAAVAYLLCLCVSVLAFAASVALAILFNAVLTAAGVGEVSIRVSAGVAILLMLGGLSFVGVRCSLALPASLDAQRVTVPWSMTKGRFWPVWTAWAAIWLLTAAACMTLYAAALPALAGATPEQAQAGPELIRGVVVSLLTLPLGIGLASWHYRRLRPASSPS